MASHLRDFVVGELESITAADNVDILADYIVSMVHSGESAGAILESLRDLVSTPAQADTFVRRLSPFLRNANAVQSKEIDEEGDPREKRQGSPIPIFASSKRLRPDLPDRPWGERRCFDFEKRGYCQRGDQCPYTHVYSESRSSAQKHPPPEYYARRHYSPNRPGMDSDALDNETYHRHSEEGGPSRREPTEYHRYPSSNPSFSAASHVHGRELNYRQGQRGRGRSFRGRGTVYQPIDRTDRSPTTTLGVEHIPENEYSEESIQSVFGKFGLVTAVELTARGRALVTFSRRDEAEAAYKSPEAYFGNRFVKVFWVSQAVPRQKTDDGYPRNRNDTVEQSKPLQKVVPLTEEEILSRRRLAQHARARQQRLKRIMELQQQKTRILERQISTQKVLFARLEIPSISDEERLNIRSQIQAISEAMKRHKQGAVSGTEITPDERELQAIDEELNVLKRMDVIEQQVASSEHASAMEESHSNAVMEEEIVGSNTEELKRRLEELRSEAQSLGIDPHIQVDAVGTISQANRGRSPFGRGRGWGTAVFPSSRPTYKLDLRPKTVFISDIPAHLREPFTEHAKVRFYIHS